MQQQQVTNASFQTKTMETAGFAAEYDKNDPFL